MADKHDEATASAGQSKVALDQTEDVTQSAERSIIDGSPGQKGHPTEEALQGESQVVNSPHDVVPPTSGDPQAEQDETTTHRIDDHGEADHARGDGQESVPPVSSHDTFDFLEDITNEDWFAEIATEFCSKSFDFGSEGYSASVSLGHELLQLTAPDPKCGLVYVRGSFSDNPDAILARAQRREGGKSTFGLKILQGSGSYTMNSHEPDTQGLVNFRWPYLRYDLNHPDNDSGECAFFSFVKDQTVFQILRLNPGSPKQSGSGNKESLDVPKRRSSLQGHLDHENGASKAASESQSPTDQTIAFRIGGTVRIGCNCRKSSNPDVANYEVEPNDSTLSCVNTKYNMKLVSRLFVNSEPVVIKNVQKTTRNGVEEMDMFFDHTILLSPGNVTIVVAAFSLRDASNNTPYGVLPPSVNLAEDLGVGYSSKYATNRLWRRLIDVDGEYGYWDYYTAASCLEQILGVTSVPMAMVSPRPASSESSESSSSRRSSLPLTLKTQREEVAATAEARPSSPDPMKLNTVSSPEQGEQARNDTSANTGGSESPQEGKKLDPNQESGGAVNAQAIEGLGQASSHPPACEEKEIDRHSHQFEQSAVDTPHNKGQSEVLQTASNPTSLDPEGVDISDAIVSVHVQPPPLLNTSQVQENNDREGLKDSGSGTASDLSNMGIALLPGIIGSRSASLKRSFWQIRYLVKAHSFLGSKFQTPDEYELRNERTAEENDTKLTGIEDIRTLYLDRVKSQLHHILVWMSNAHVPGNYSQITPALRPYGTGTRPECVYWGWEVNNQDNAIYPPIAIWYVIHNYDGDLPDSVMEHLAKNITRLKDQFEPEESVSTNARDPGRNLRVPLLTWYYYACLSKLYDQLSKRPLLKASSLTSPSTKPEGAKELADKASRFQTQAEKAMGAATKAKTNYYSESDEFIDRLIFLGRELGLFEDLNTKASFCFERARRRVFGRTSTKVLNPGTVQDNSSTASPWELTCLTHHTRLALGGNPEEDDDLVDPREKLERFVTSSFSFVSSWDMSKSDIAACWWDMSASSVICSTLLEMRTKGKSSHVSLHDADPSSTGQPSKDKPIPMKQLDKIQGMEDSRRDPPGPKGKNQPEEESIADLLKRQLEMQEQSKKENNVVFAFDWTRCQPPTVFHLDTWVQSLDDTPELFRSPQTKKVDLRNEIRAYISRISTWKKEQAEAKKRKKSETPTTRDRPAPMNKEDPANNALSQDPDWRLKDISQSFPKGELSFLSVYDIGLNGIGKSICINNAGRLAIQNGNDKFDFNFAHLQEKGNVYGPTTSQVNLLFWLAHLDGELLDLDPEKCEKSSVPVEQRFGKLEGEKRKTLLSPGFRDSTCQTVEKGLLKVLNDSLVDQNARYRIFFVQRCCPIIVKAFIYMWHVDAIDTYDDHFRDTSHFFDSKEREQTWITSISLSYWGFKRTGARYNSLFDERRDSAEFPPRTVALAGDKGKVHWWQKGEKETPTSEKNKKKGKAKEKKKEKIEEDSSSLVISGDRSGSWWICSVISPVLSELAMQECIKSAKPTLDDFIHQPSTGRCVVFLLFLGKMCESLSEEYEHILNKLTDAIKLGREVLKQGLDVDQTEDAILRLKAMLWALEVLRVVDDNLRESLEKVREGKEKMQNYIQQGPGQRHPQLERKYQVLLEEFNKRYDRLNQIHTLIEQKINQITRYREGISAVSNLEDSHTALKQNETIRILTYITIAYLPLSFVVALFSISFISGRWGGREFGGLLTGFLIATFLLAASLEPIIRIWNEIAKFTRKKLNPRAAAQDGEETEDEEEQKKGPEQIGTSNSTQPPTVYPLPYSRATPRSKPGSSKSLENGESNMVPRTTGIDL